MRLAAVVLLLAGVLAAATGGGEAPAPAGNPAPPDGKAKAAGPAAPAAKAEACLECHKGLDEIDGKPGPRPPHPSCVSCHRGDPAAGLPAPVSELRERLRTIQREILEAKGLSTKAGLGGQRVLAERELQKALRPAIEAAHRGLIRDPGDPSVVKTTCGACHAHGQTVANHLRSIHATSAGIIRGVRHAYGPRAGRGPEASALPFDIREESTPPDRPVRTLVPLGARSAPPGAPPAAPPDPAVEEGGPDALLRLQCLSCHAGFSLDAFAHEFYRGFRESNEREQMASRIRQEEARLKRPLTPAEREAFRRSNPVISQPLPPGDPSRFQMVFGEARGRGCSACHFEYHESGLSESADETVPWHERISALETVQARSPEGRYASTDPVARVLRNALRDRERPLTEAFTIHPRRHTLVARVRTEACLSCHHCPFGTGPDFVGRVRAAPASAVPPEAAGFRRIYGSAWTEGTPGIHFEKGFSCADCHRGRDLHGDGRIARHAGEGVSVRCETCHGTLERGPTGEDARGRPFPGLVRKPAGWRFRTSSGVERTIPLPSDRRGRSEEPRAHRVSSHGRIECYACHAPAAPLAYGLRVLEDYGPDPALLEKSRFKWRLDHVPWRMSLDLLAEPSAASWPLRIGRIVPEIAQSVLGPPALGVNARGRISPIRPGPEILLMRMDRDGNSAERMAMPRLREARPLSFRPFVPHGIRRQARDCGSCHGNPAAAGVASGMLRVALPGGGAMDLDGFVRRGPEGGWEPAAESWVEGARTLNAKEVETLLAVESGEGPSKALVAGVLGGCAILGLALILGRRRRRRA